MKPTSEPTRNGILSAVPFPEELLTMTSVFRSTTTIPATEQSPSAAAGPHRTVVDSSSAYGCVDWYMYPDAKPESAAA